MISLAELLIKDKAYEDKTIVIIEVLVINNASNVPKVWANLTSLAKTVKQTTI